MTTRHDMNDGERPGDSELWDRNRGVIRSRKGGWKVGQGVTIHGRSLFDELMGSASWFQVWLLSITGRMFERRVADLCEACWLCLSYPDPRIWCNQVSALAGTMRCTPVAALSAGTLTADSLKYGGWAVSLSARFFGDTLAQRRASGAPLEQLLRAMPVNAAGCPAIPGFHRPVALGDERVAVLGRVLCQLGLAEGEHLRLALEIHAYLKEHHGEEINSGGYIAAALLDLGLSAGEQYRFFSMGAAAGAMACYVDAMDREAESFLPMRCADVDYQGPAPRPFPQRAGRPLRAR
jgi:hypothetical protein